MSASRFHFFKRTLVGLFVLMPFLAFSQTAQVNIIGLAPQINFSTWSEALREYESGRYQIQFLYQNPVDAAPVSFRFRTSIRQNGTVLYTTTSRPTNFTPGLYTYRQFDDEPRIVFEVGIQDVIADLSTKFQSIAFRSGLIPEGSYELEVEPMTDAPVLTVPGTATTEMRYPEPPVLIAPMNEAQVSEQPMVFSWTPVVGHTGNLYSYEFTLVKILPNQTPLQALESNPPLTGSTVRTTQTQLVYTAQYPPLEDGQTYAVQVKAKEIVNQTPVTRDGLSEIVTFTRGMQVVADVPTDGNADPQNDAPPSWDEIEVVPGFATLSGLTKAFAQDAAGFKTLNGFATLKLMLAGEAPKDVRIRLQDLQIQPLANVVTGGRVYLPNDVQNLGVPFPTENVQLSGFYWDYAQGFVAEGKIRHPQTGNWVTANGAIRFDLNGFSGFIEANLPNPIQYRSGEITLTMGKLGVMLPNGETSGIATLNLFGQQTDCRIEGVSLDQAANQLPASCLLNLKLPILGAQEKVRFTLQRLNGTFSIDPATNILTADATIMGELALRNQTGQYCGVVFPIRVTDQVIPHTDQAISNCNSQLTVLETGSFDLGIRQLKLDQFRFESNTWAFDLRFDAALLSPFTGTTPVTTFSDLHFSGGNIELPAVNATPDALIGLPSVRISPLNAQLTGLRMNPASVDWMNLQPKQAGDWALRMDWQLTPLADVPNLPPCFQNTTFALKDVAWLSNAPEFSWISEAQNLSIPCAIPLKSASLNDAITNLEIKSLNALFSARIQDGIPASLTASLLPAGTLNFRNAVQCSAPVSFGGGTASTDAPLFMSLAFNGNGNWIGRMYGNANASCTIRRGDYTAEFSTTNLNMIWDEKANRQNFGTLSYAGLGKLAGLGEVPLRFNLDLLTGQFPETGWEIGATNGVGTASMLAFPKTNPVLFFNAPNLQFTPNGIRINGRGELKGIGDAPQATSGDITGVTFDEVVLDVKTHAVLEGKITLDTPLNVQVLVDRETGNLHYTTNATATADHLQFMLPGPSSITATGWSFAPPENIPAPATIALTQGQLRLGELDFPTLNVSPSADLSFKMEPFGIQQGEIIFAQNGNPIARITPSGLRIEGDLVTAILPDQLPLPLNSVAYLETKQNGAFVVESENLGNGLVRIRPKAGKRIRLITPILKGNAADTPALDVSFDQIVFNPNTRTVTGGEFSVNIGNRNDLKLPDAIPFIPQTLGFSDGKLTIAGDLKLFGKALGAGCPVTLSTSTDLAWHADVQCQPNQFIPLVPNSNIIGLNVRNLGISATYPTGNTPPQFLFTGDADVQIRTPENAPLASAETQFRFSQDGFNLTRFNPQFTEPQTLNLGGLGLRLSGLRNVELGFSDQQFRFRVGLLGGIWLGLQGGRGFEVPLDALELTENGIVLPDLDLHEGTNPPLNVPYVNLGGLQVQPIGFRMAKTALNLFQGNLPALNAGLDLRIKLAGLAERSPELANQTLTIRNAGYTNGVLTGDLTGLELLTPKPLALGGGTSVQVSGFSGKLMATNGQQDAEIALSGLLNWPSVVQNAQNCNTPLSINFRASGVLEAQIQNVAPCGTIRFDPVALSFQNAGLDLKMGGGEERFVLRGTAQATISTAGQAPVSGTGQLAVNLLTGDLLDPTSIALNDPFVWQYPKDNPIFAFNVQNAVLSTGGLRLNGQGGIKLDGMTVSTTFTNAVFGLGGNVLQSGSIQISAPFAFNFFFDSGKWGLVDAATALPATGNVLRMGIPANVTITKDGLSLNGQAAAQLRIGGKTFPQLTQKFGPLTLGFGSVYVRDGRVEYFKTRDDGREERIAWLDRDGFHPDNIGEAVADLLPEKLPLPTTSIAFIQLKQNNNLLVATENLGNDRMRLFTRPGQSTDLIFEGIAGKPSAKVSFSLIFAGLKVESFERLEVDATEALNQKLFNGLPIALQQLRFQVVNGDPALLVDAQIKLPQMLDREAPLLLQGLRITPTGFDNATFTIGNAAQTFQSECSTNPLKKLDFGGGAVNINVCGVSVQVQNNTLGGLKLSGQLASTLFKDQAGQPGRFQIVGGYANNWDLSVLVDPRFAGQNLGNSGEDQASPYGAVLAEGIPLGFADFVPSRIALVNSDAEFGLVLDGAFKMEKLLGKGFSVGITGLKIGTGGVALSQAEFTNAQQTKFLGDAFPLLIRRLRLNIQNSVLKFGLDGELTFLSKKVAIQNLTIGTDGSFLMGNTEVNLLNPNDPIQLIENVLSFNTLKLGVENNRPKITAAGMLTLPDPFGGASGEVGLTVALDANGAPQFTPIYPTFDFGKDEVVAGAPEVDLGGFAKLKLTGLKIVADWQNLSNSAVMASAKLQFGGDPNKEIQFGSPANIDQNWGFRVSPQNGIQWQAPNARFQFSVDAGVFRINNLTLELATQNGFGVRIGGLASLNIAGAEGTFGYAGLTVGTRGIIDAGGPTGEIGVKLMNVVSLRMRGFSFSSAPTTLKIPTSSGGPGGVQQSEEAVAVRYYLKTGADITIGDGLGGGVDEVLVYERQDGGFNLSIKNAHLQLGGIAKATASMQYTTDARGFVLRVAGGVELAPGIGGALAGKIGVRDGKVTMGIFAKVDFPIELFPGVITLTSIGAGFFIRPEQADMELVMTLPGLREALYKPDKVPQVAGMDFTALLFAQVEIVRIARGRALLAFSFGDDFDKFDFTLNARATILDLPIFQAGLYLNIHKEPNLFKIEGEAGVEIDYGFLLYTKAAVGFNVISRNGATKWAIWGNVSSRVLLIGMTGEFFVGDPGFLFKLSIDAELDVAIVTAEAHFKFMVWWRSNGKNMGAYGEISASLEVLGFEVASATARGAFINRNGNTLFYAAARVKIIFAKVGIWLANYNGDWDGGTGSNEAYEHMIDEAIRDAEDMKNQANEAQRELQQALNDAAFLTQEQLEASGRALILMAPEQKNALLNQNSDTWTYSAKYYRFLNRGYRPTAFEEIYRNVIAGDVQENFAGEASMRTQMLQRIQALSENQTTMMTKLEDIKNVAIQSVKESETLDQNIQAIASPVSNVQMNWVGEEPPSYSFDENADRNNQQALANLAASIEAIEGKYRTAIQQVWAHIAKTDFALLGQADWMNRIQRPDFIPDQPGGAQSEIVTTAQKFAEAVSWLYYYHAHRVAHVWNLRSSYAQRLNQLNTFAPAAINEINTTTDQAWNQRCVPVAYPIPNPCNDSINEAAAGMTSILYQRMTIGTNVVYNDMATNATLLYNNTRDAARTGNEAMFKQNVGRIQREFWVERLQLGLRTLLDHDIPTRIQSGIYEFATARRSLMKQYEAFSARINEIHRLKAEMTTTLYAMVTDYNTWRKSTNLTPLNGLEGFKTGISDALQPPVITSIQYNGARDPYMPNYASMSFSWQATHPNEVAEYAFAYNGGSGSVNASKPASSSGGVSSGSTSLSDRLSMIAIAQPISVAIFTEERPVMSVGKNTWQNLYTFKTKDGETVQDITFTLQARGPAGNVARRTVSVKVNAGETEIDVNRQYWSANNPTGNGNVLTQDFSPPAISDVALNTQNGSGQFWGELDPALGVAPVWTNKQNRVKLTMNASDPESDVKQYYFAIGSAVGGTDVADWQPMVGTISRSSYGVSLSGEASGLNLQENRNYFFSIKAENGQGLSATRSIPNPVRVDLNPPKTPALIRFTNLNANVQDATMPDPVVYPLVDAASVDQYAHRGAAGYTMTHYEVEIFKPLDQIRRFGYVVTKKADSTGVIADALARRNLDQFWYLDPPVRYTNAIDAETQVLNIRNTLPYETAYVLVFAEDYLGRRSPALLIRPGQTPDPTRPLAPIMRAYRWFNAREGTGITFVNTEPGADQETSIESCEYAIGTTAGATDVQNWTKSNACDRGNMSGFAAPDVVQHQNNPVYFSFRVRNRQGQYSGLSVVGPADFRRDDSPPEVTSATAYWDRAAEQIAVKLIGIYDKESIVSSYMQYELVLRRADGLTTTTPISRIQDQEGILAGEVGDRYLELPFSSSTHTPILIRVLVYNDLGLYRYLTLSLR